MEEEIEGKEKLMDVPALTLFELFEYLPFCLRLGLCLLLLCLLARATARSRDTRRAKIGAEPSSIYFQIAR
jgi:hypothetical protein